MRLLVQFHSKHFGLTILTRHFGIRTSQKTIRKYAFVPTFLSQQYLPFFPSMLIISNQIPQYEQMNPRHTSCSPPSSATIKFIIILIALPLIPGPL